MTEYDVFLSHNGCDKDMVERVAEHLRRAGLRPFLDIWELTPGGRWQPGLAAALAASRACAVFVGERGYGNWQLEELEYALAGGPRTRVFAVLLPGTPKPFDPQSLPAFLSTRTWVDMSAGVDSARALQTLMNAVRGVPNGAPVAVTSGTPPYRGLETFREEDAELFFGRDREVQRVLEQLDTSRFVSVLGSSGSGKSSLVRAGVIPRLRGGAVSGIVDWTVSVLRPGAKPLEALAIDIAGTTPGRSLAETLDDFGSDPRSLHLAVSHILGADAPNRRFLIFVDQFEEVFSLCDDEDERQRFVANLVRAATANGGRAVVVLTMRADFYARVTKYPDLAELVTAAHTLLGPMDAEGLQQAIEAPALGQGLAFESGLVPTILADVGNDAGALPLLEHALLELWRLRLGELLTLDGYVEAGRVQGALTQRAEEVYGSLAGQQPEVARRLFLRLTQPGDGTGDTRRRATLEELAPARDRDAFDDVLEKLVAERLLTVSEATVEISHEALIRDWPRLQGWIETARHDLVLHRRLTRAAAEWVGRGRDEDALYRGGPLAEAREWQERDPDALNDTEREFLDDGMARERRDLEADRRRARDRGRLAALLALVVVLLLVGVGVAVRQTIQAGRDRDTAETQRDVALSQQLGETAQQQLAGDPELALLLARKAASLAQTQQADAALRAALASPLESILHGASVDEAAIAFTADGRVAAIANEAGVVNLWDLDRARVRRRVAGGLGDVTHVALSRTGDRLLIAGEGGAAIFDPRSGDRVGTLDGAPPGESRCGFTPTGAEVTCAGRGARLWDAKTGARIDLPPARLATLSGDATVLALADARGTVRTYELADRRVGHTLDTGGARPTSMELDAVGGRLLTDDGRELTLKDVASARTVLRLRAPVIESSLDPSGDMVVVERPVGESSDPRVRVWRAGTWTTLETDSSGVGSLSYAPEGRVAVGETAGGARVFDVTNGRRLVDLPYTGAGEVVTAVFAPGGRVLTADDRGQVRVWRPGVTPLARAGTVAYGAAFSPDGHMVAAVEDEQLRLWDTKTGRPVRRPGARIEPGSSGDVHLGWSGDGRTFRAWLFTDVLHVMDARGGADRPVRLDDGFVSALSESSRYAWVSEDTAEVRDGTRSLLRVVAPTADLFFDGIAGTSLSADGRRLAVATADRTGELWDVERKRRIGSARWTASLAGIALRPDGRQAAAEDENGTLLILDPPFRSWRTIATRLQGGITADVSYAPDGGRLLITDSNGAALWTLDGRRLVDFPDAVTATLSDNASNVVLIGPNGPPTLRRCDECGTYPQLVQRADRRLHRELTDAESRRFLPAFAR